LVVKEFMIAAEVMTSQFFKSAYGEWPSPDYENSMMTWCLNMLGPKAEFRDQVSAEYPWTCSRGSGTGWTTWYFAHEESATMFRLRWL
jgi:hypothetical protein